jgi:hypothetical protein
MTISAKSFTIRSLAVPVDNPTPGKISLRMPYDVRVSCFPGLSGRVRYHVVASGAPYRGRLRFSIDWDLEPPITRTMDALKLRIVDIIARSSAADRRRAGLL